MSDMRRDVVGQPDAVVDAMQLEPATLAGPEWQYCTASDEIGRLLLSDGSVLAIDPKGELARISAQARRQKGQKVVVLDPFGASGITPSGRFNPLDELDVRHPNVKDDAALIRYYVAAATSAISWPGSSSPTMGSP